MAPPLYTVKVIPTKLKSGSQHYNVEVSQKGFIRINGIVEEIDRSRLSLINDKELFNELMYEAYERCAKKVRAKDGIK